MGYGKSMYLINRPQFNPEYLKTGKCVQVTRDSKTKVEGIIADCTPLELTVAYLRTKDEWVHLKIEPNEVWENKYTLTFMKK